MTAEEDADRPGPGEECRQDEEEDRSAVFIATR